jgi:hypothetical protein
MAKEKSLVEDALLQMRNLEEAVSQNAKGILASTMKQEIKELVKESIVSEQDDDDEEIDAEVDMDMDSDEDEMEMDMDSDEDEMDMDIDSDEDEMEMDADMGMGMGDDEVIDLSDEDSISDEELLKVFMAMGEKDGIIVKKDDDQIHLTDENKDSEYLIQMGESEESYESDEVLYEDDYNEMGESDEELYGVEESDEFMESDDSEVDGIIEKLFNETESFDEGDQVVYEIVMDSDEDPYGEDPMMEDYDDEEMDFDVHESMKPKIGKGAKIGKPSKFSYKSSKGGFKETMKTGTKGVGMGKVKSTIFNKPVKRETKEGAMMGKGKPSSMFVSGKSKEETKEASRTLGNGSMFRKGGLPKPRAHSKANISIEEQRNINQVQILREKNEEYRKALNVFRDKLNEVAIFNSNLAYATRLFTEHSTSKQEKINILRRFDGVETIKESKNLYKTIKDELSTKTKGSITESIETRIEKTPASGSASTLIESKTYENPQFLRMKDLMNKIN